MTHAAVAHCDWPLRWSALTARAKRVSIHVHAHASMRGHDSRSAPMAAVRRTSRRLVAFTWSLRVGMLLSTVQTHAL